MSEANADNIKKLEAVLELPENAELIDETFYVWTTRYGLWSTICLLYTSPSPRDKRQSRMPSSA